MPVQNLNAIFRPRRIAMFGLDNQPDSISGITLRNLMEGGFEGVIYPVHPHREAVLGIPAYPSVDQLPQTPDLAVIFSPANDVPSILDNCGAKRIKGVIIMSGGFREAGEKGKQLEEETRKVAAKWPGMRIIGPNCRGIIVPGNNLNLSYAGTMPERGNIAFISQSGALGATLLDWAAEMHVGFSFFVSLGNAMDVSFGDMIDYFGQDSRTYSIVLYVEKLGNARKFLSAARAFARKKPIIVYKSGRFPQSAKAALSHTGAPATNDQVCEALLRRAGLARVYNMGNIFDFTDLAAHKRIPRKKGLAIVTNAGGPGVMATDALISKGGSLAELSKNSLSELDRMLPENWSHNNPVDLGGDAGPERYQKALEIILRDENIDSVLVMVTPQATVNLKAVARKIIQLETGTVKLIMTAWMGGAVMQPGRRLLTDARIPLYATPEQAIQAYMTLVQYAKNLALLFETPKEIPVSFTYNRKTLRKKYLKEFFAGKKMLSENDSKNLLLDYGIPVTTPKLAVNVEEALTIANEKKFPVVLKIQSPDIKHKSEVGGVLLDVRTEEMLRVGFEQMLENVKHHRPDAAIEGITIQKMIDTRDAVELFVTIKKEVGFGTVMTLGTGGVAAELFNDIRIEFPPLNERLARQMLKSLKIYPLLKGYRGNPPKNIDRLVEVLIRLSYLAADYPEIAELTINPLIVTPGKVLALDAVLVVDTEIIGKKVPEYSHLLIKPYPERLVTLQTLKDGTEITLRPIKPEDEPLWLEMLNNCSKSSIYSRFRYDFHYKSHEVATRFCVIDYDREMGIVAESSQNGKKQLIGEGRLVADPDLNTAEFAVLIADNRQGNGLGKLITEYCLNIADEIKVKRVIAETTSDNKPMIKIFRNLGFDLKFYEEGTVYAEKYI